MTGPYGRPPPRRASAQVWHKFEALHALSTSVDAEVVRLGAKGKGEATLDMKPFETRGAARRLGGAARRRRPSPHAAGVSSHHVGAGFPSLYRRSHELCLRSQELCQRSHELCLRS